MKIYLVRWKTHCVLTEDDIANGIKDAVCRSGLRVQVGDCVVSLINHNEGEAHLEASGNFLPYCSWGEIEVWFDQEIDRSELIEELT